MLLPLLYQIARCLHKFLLKFQNIVSARGRSLPLLRIFCSIQKSILQNITLLAAHRRRGLILFASSRARARYKNFMLSLLLLKKFGYSCSNFAPCCRVCVLRYIFILLLTKGSKKGKIFNFKVCYQYCKKIIVIQAHYG